MITARRPASGRKACSFLVGAAIALGADAASREGPRVSAQTAPSTATQVQTSGPAGEVIKGEFTASKVYPGTWREYWVYLPKQLDRSKPAPVMVFQDGLQYNAPAVFDDLTRSSPRRRADPSPMWSLAGRTWTRCT